MAIKQNKHEHHQIEVHIPALYRRGPNRGQVCTTHYGAMICVTCQRQIRWLSRRECEFYTDTREYISADQFAPWHDSCDQEKTPCRS